MHTNQHFIREWFKKNIIWGIFIFISLILGFSCKDPLPPRINPYQSLKTKWRFDPKFLKSDTLITSISPSLFVNTITIIPSIINEWDEFISDTSYTNVQIKITLLNKPDISEEFVIFDSTMVEKGLRRGDSTWASFDWFHNLQQKRIYQHLPEPTPNFEKNRLEWEVAHIRLEGTIQLFKNVLPVSLPPKEILIFYWVKMT